MSAYQRQPEKSVATCAKSGCWTRIFWQQEHTRKVADVALDALLAHSRSKHPTAASIGTVDRDLVMRAKRGALSR